MLSKIRQLLKEGIITEQYSMNSVLDELKFAAKRGRGHMLAYLKNRLVWFFYPKWNITTKFPTHVDIEISNICQLNCPMCYTTTDYFKQKVKRSLLDFNLFKKAVDECKRYSVYSLRFSWRGEPLMHPRIIDMLKYAKDAGIKEVSFLTNGGNLDSNMIDQLIINNLDWITVSFDGLYDVYERYRKPLKFKETVEKLKTLQRRKKELGKQKPVLKVQTVWSAIEKDPNAYFKFMHPIVDEIAFNPEKDKRYYQEFESQAHKKDYVCPRLWQRIYVSASGNIGVCLSDVYENYVIGDLRNMTIYEAWNSEKFRTMRKKHKLGNRLDYIICRRCQAGLKRRNMTFSIDGRKIDAKSYDFS